MIVRSDVTGMLAALFVHRGSRPWDPNLHTHVAVNNKEQALDGRWLAIDGRVLHKTAVAVLWSGIIPLEAQLRDRLGLRFAARPTSLPGRRQMREVNNRRPRGWPRHGRPGARSSRRAARSCPSPSRPPMGARLTKVEEIALMQQATLETRPGAHPPRSLSEQRAQWRASAEQLLGAQGVQRMLADSLPRTWLALPAADRRGSELAGARPGRIHCGHHHLRRLESGYLASQPCPRGSRAPRPSRRPATRADRPGRGRGRRHGAGRSVRLGFPYLVIAAPAVLRRRDGQSVYEVAGAQLYTPPDSRRGAAHSRRRRPHQRPDLSYPLGGAGRPPWRPPRTAPSSTW